MPRSVNAVASRARRKKILKAAKGYYGKRKNVYTVAKNVMEKGMTYSYVGRKLKKREYRTLWIARINAAVRAEGMTYSQFIHKLGGKNIELNRKVLADLAMNEPESFKKLVDNLEVIGVGCFEVYIVFQCLLHYKRKMRTFGTITVKIFAFIFVLFKSIGKHFFCFVYLHSNLWEIGKLKRGSILINKPLYINSIILKILVFHLKIFLGELESLAHQVGVAIVHLLRIHFNSLQM